MATGNVTAPDVLDWLAFSTLRFPGRRRHDLGALVAYGAYRRLHAAGEEHGLLESNDGGTGSWALDAWENEGGPLFP